MIQQSAAVTVENPPKGLIRLRDGRLVPRRHGWLQPGESLTCPFGHRVHLALSLHEGAASVMCKVPDAPSDEPGRPFNSTRCRCLLYVATGTMGVFWVDITEEEDQSIKKQGIRPTGVARYLGIDFPK